MLMLSLLLVARSHDLIITPVRMLKIPRSPIGARGSLRP
jgi:hypothetical protein